LISSGDWADIEGALNAELVSLVTSCSVILENQGSEDGGAIEAGEKHVQGNFLPSTSETIEVNRTGKERAIGVYQATVRIPRYVGKWEANQIADDIIIGFKRGSVFSLNNISVRVISVYPNPAVVEDGFFSLPITINWQADL